jgi:hypothetical protein
MSDFEDKLRSLGLRQPPADLRREVLAAAASVTEQPVRWTWRDWLWPSPLAWGALAVLLTGAVIFDSVSSSNASAPAAVAVEADAFRSPVYAFSMHRQDLNWLDSQP